MSTDVSPRAPLGASAVPTTPDPISYSSHPLLPVDLLEKWQNIVNLMAEIISVPSGLLMQAHSRDIEILLTSRAEDNPFHSGESADKGSGIYCETVIQQQAPLLVPDARRDTRWKHKLDVLQNMVAYLGFPIHWPDGDVFGTLCVLDRQERSFPNGAERLIEQLRNAIEADLRLLTELDARRRAQEALQLSEERYALAQRAAKIGSWDWDITTGDLVWSEQIESMFGFQPGGFAGTYSAFCHCLHPEDADFVRDSVRAAIDDDQDYDIEHRIVHPDGTTRWLAETGDVVRTEDGTPIRMLGMVRDVTDRVEAEREREHLIASLGSKNTELEQFAYTVSHDLKSPLFTIRGFLGMLGEDLRQGDLSQAATDLARISSAAERMSHLLEGVLQLSRIGRIANPSERVAMADLVNDALEATAGCLEASNVRVIVQQNLPTVYGDRLRLQEVLQNLIENAVKFRGDRPQPKIEIGCRDASDNQGAVTWYVRDNGIGISKEHLSRVFGLFDQLDPAKDGTGIGLALVQRIIDVHQGQIWVESEGPGNGATFFFDLPAPSSA